MKAQVKIIINTGNGRRLLVNRQFQVIKKANGKVEMKTLDTFMKEGDEDAQCKKLEQVNVEVPARMGVSSTKTSPTGACAPKLIHTRAAAAHSPPRPRNALR